MKHLVSSIAITACLLLPAAAAVAAANPSGTGQPNQSCQSLPGSPGNASGAPGSAFNESGSGKAGSVYAGTQPQNSVNPKSVSQYDVACFQQPP